MGRRIVPPPMEVCGLHGMISGRLASLPDLEWQLTGKEHHG
jgi:hypothetical protein